MSGAKCPVCLIVPQCLPQPHNSCFERPDCYRTAIAIANVLLPLPLPDSANAIWLRCCSRGA